MHCIKVIVFLYMFGLICIFGELIVYSLTNRKPLPHYNKYVGILLLHSYVMYVRMYVCMYACMYVCTHVCMHVCVYVAMHGMYAWYILELKRI